VKLAAAYGTKVVFIQIDGQREEGVEVLPPDWYTSTAQRQWLG
jgi:hypothetical protein